ncbi:hypothetical protein TWF506_003171 [Arthrobotrys conoides]|uniref:Hydrophobin n=1 Tax=Arthrobotrys conoides TaxID=74498 RepID=A0AAN8NCB3_9PEZI
MYFPILTFLALITSCTATANAPAGTWGKNPDIPDTLTVGDIHDRCDIGLSVSCCVDNAFEKIIENGCYPLTEPELKRFNFVDVCFGVPACCSTVMFENKDVPVTSGGCQEMTITTEANTPDSPFQALKAAALARGSS